MTRKKYIEPTLTVVSFRTEHGYALSLPIEQQLNPIDNYIEVMMLENNTYHETETFGEHDVWVEDKRNAFWGTF